MATPYDTELHPGEGIRSGNYPRRELMTAREIISALLAACAAKEKLLTCYRLGAAPSEKLFRELELARVAVEAAKAFLAKS